MCLCSFFFCNSILSKCNKCFFFCLSMTEMFNTGNAHFIYWNGKSNYGLYCTLLLLQTIDILNFVCDKISRKFSEFLFICWINDATLDNWKKEIKYFLLLKSWICKAGLNRIIKKIFYLHRPFFLSDKYSSIRKPLECLVRCLIDQ